MYCRSGMVPGIRRFIGEHRYGSLVDSSIWYISKEYSSEIPKVCALGIVEGNTRTQALPGTTCLDQYLFIHCICICVLFVIYIKDIIAYMNIYKCMTTVRWSKTWQNGAHGYASIQATA